MPNDDKRSHLQGQYNHLKHIQSFKKSLQYLKQNEYKDFEKLSNSPLHRNFNTYPLSHNYMLTIQKDTEDV